MKKTERETRIHSGTESDDSLIELVACIAAKQFLGSGGMESETAAPQNVKTDGGGKAWSV